MLNGELNGRAVKYNHKTVHLRCLAGLRMRLW